MEGDYLDITKKALKDWSNRSLFNIEDYGYILESYQYNLNDETGEVKDISYNRFNPDGTPEKTVYVENRGNGHYKRSVILWPNVSNQELIDGYLSSDVLEMKLDLETIDPNFSLDKVRLYTADSKDPCISHEPDSPVYYLNINIKEVLDRCTVDYHMKRVESDFDFKETWIQVDDDMKVAYYEDQGIYRVYYIDGNDAVSEVRVLPNCTVNIDYLDGTINVLYYDGDIEHFYLKEETDSQIDCLRDCSYHMLECDNDLMNNMMYTYDEDCLVQSAVNTYDETRGSKIVKFDRGDGEVYRVETYSSNSGYPDYDGPYKRSEYAAVYPTGVTLNNENFMYKLWKLWNYDKAEFDDISGGMNTFFRGVYCIRNDVLADLIAALSRYPEDIVLF